MVLLPFIITITVGLTLGVLLLLHEISNAASVSLYITDLPIFSSLAPCAATAVADVVQGLTWSQCPPAITALQSCACSKDQNSAAILTNIESYVTGHCGTTATEDVTSATQVFDVYCGGSTPATATDAVTVTQYITDIPAFSDLAPCAESALGNAVQGLTWSLCPGDASALASCACLKNQNSLYVSKSINDGVLGDCGTTHSADVASAEAVFAGYCGLNNGTSSFPTPTPLSGSLDYYITDLPNFSSLAPCAQSAVEDQVQGCTWSICPAAASMLVSCVCAKDQNSQYVTSGIMGDVKGKCGTTDTADISSALAVFDYYCSAGRGSATPKGVTVTGELSSAPALYLIFGTRYLYFFLVTSAGNNARSTSTARTGGSGFTTITATSTGIGIPGISPSDTGSTSPNSGSSPDTSSSKPTPTGAIVGGVVGGCAAIVIAAILIWWTQRRKSSKTQPDPSQPSHGRSVNNEGGYSKPDLGSTPMIKKGHSSLTGSVVRKVAGPSEIGHGAGEQPEEKELSDEAVLRATEAPADSGVHEVSGVSNPSELPNSIRRHEMSGMQRNNVYELPSPQ